MVSISHLFPCENLRCSNFKALNFSEIVVVVFKFCGSQFFKFWEQVCQYKIPVHNQLEKILTNVLFLCFLQILQLF